MPGMTADELDWTIFDDPARVAAVASIDERLALTSPTLQRIARIAATLAGSEFAQISLLGHSHFVPSSFGLTYNAEGQHTPARDGLCSVTMAAKGVLSIVDTRLHPWVRDLPPVTTGFVGSYFGAPLFSSQGLIIGALCVFDRDPREWIEPVRTGLIDCAELVARELEHLSSLSPTEPPLP
jgi:GAF domain-containing protein